ARTAVVLGGTHDVSIVGALVRAYPSILAVEDASADPAVPLKAQRERVHPFGQARVEMQDAVAVFHRQNRLPCRDTPENGDGDGLVERSGGGTPQTVERSNAARGARATVDIALFLQGLQVGTHTIGRTNAERHTNLANARWDPRGAHLPFDVIEDLALSVRKEWSHA